MRQTNKKKCLVQKKYLFKKPKKLIKINFHKNMTPSTIY